MNVEQPHPTREDLFAYRDGELKADRRVVIEAHVVGCSACRELIDEVSGLEADLQSGSVGADERYLERLQEKVMARVGAADTTPSTERRRSTTEMEWEEKRAREPKLPWLALISTFSATAAILVVGVILIRQGAVWKRPPAVSVLERSAPDAARSRAKSDSAGARAPEMGAFGKKNSNRELASKDEAGSEDGKLTARGGAAKDQLGRIDAGTSQAVPSPSERSLARLQKEVDQREMKSVADRAESAKGMAAEPAPSAAANQAAPAPSAAAPAAGGKLESLFLRYNLPPVWGPGVSDENILRAEPALRNLYRTGGAVTGADSARVRLYLAEALRVEAGATPDSATVDEITHHYRRAIRLAGDDAELARIAADRLQDFLKEQREETPPGE